MHEATTLSRNFPYLFDFFFCSHDVSHARHGCLIDAELVDGGIMLWLGHRHLVVEVHALRAVATALRGWRHA